MAEHVELNGVVLLVERAGAGAPTVVFVHGSWDDHSTWNRVASAVDGTVVSYDRRGHSGSRQPLGQGSIDEDVDDLVALIEWIDRGPVAVVGHSYGATMSLLVACRRPDLVHHVVAHEPPLFAVLRDDPLHAATLADVLAAMQHAADCIESGRPEEGAAYFVEHVGFGPGVWDGVFDDEERAIIVANADTWLDQYRDPRRLALSLDDLAATEVPVLITRGNRSPALYGPALDRVLAAAPVLSSLTIDGCGHAVAHTHPAELAAAINEFVAS